MSKQRFSCSTPIKFSEQTLEELRESALKNQRSLSGEIRFRVAQTLQQQDTEDNLVSECDGKISN